MALTREAVRAAIERAGDAHWAALIRHHEDAYPASPPTPGEVARAEAERLNGLGFGDAQRYELMESRVTRGEGTVTLVHVVRDTEAGTTVETPPYTNYE